MRFLFLFFVSTAAIAAPEFPLRLKGTNHLGEPCALTVEKAFFGQSGEREWWNWNLVVRTSYQEENSPSILAHKSPTPAVLYGMNPAREQISLHFFEEELNPAAIRYFIFQTRGKNAPVQVRCVFGAANLPLR